MAQPVQPLIFGGKTYLEARPKPPLGDRIIRGIFRGLAKILGAAVWWLVLKPAGMLAKHSARQAWRGLTHVLRESTRGKARAMWAPMWFTAAAVLPIPGAVVLWLILGVLLDIASTLPARDTRPSWVRRVLPARKWLSTRERVLVARASALVALWHDWAPVTPWQVSWALLAVLVVGCSVPWWRGRKIREADVPPLKEAWGYALAEYPQDLAGEWRDIEDLGDRQAGVLRLATGDPVKVAGMDAVIECAIDRRAPFDLPPGSMNITRDEGLPSARDVRVVLMRDPRKAKNAVHYFDGPTLRQDGTFIAGYTVGGRPIMGRLHRPGGSVNNLILGGPGSGKGGATRSIALEAAMAENPETGMGLCYRVGIDGKHGAGMPELADTFDVYARDPEEWEAALGMAVAVLKARLKRYGAQGRSRWHWSIDPLFRVTLDEIVAIAQKYPKYCADMEQYTAQGRSLGCGMDANTQRGGGDDMWSTRFRANLRGNGTISIGQQGDTTVGMLATQDTMVDLTRLPQAPGYMFAVSKVEQGIPLQPFRYRYSVSQEEHEFDGLPLGDEGRTVEDWARSQWIRRATLHDDDLAAIAPWLERLGRSVPSTTDPLVHEPAVPTLEDTEEDATWVESDPEPTLDSLARTAAVLPEVGVMSDKDVAAATGVSDRQARNNLRKLAEKDPPEAAKVGPNQWRRAS